MTIPLEPLKDHFGKVINVGDIVLGAKAGNKYVDTTYHFAVVVSRTNKLIRVSQLANAHPHVDKSMVEASLISRNGRPAGKVVPYAVINTGVNVGMTQVEMEALIKKPQPQPVDSFSIF
jgi:hypothetical protein